EIYDTIPHPALGRSPADAFRASLAVSGHRPYRHIAYDSAFALLTLPAPRDRPVRLVTPQGVNIHNLPTPRCVATQPLSPAALLDQPWDVRLAYFVERAIVAHARLRQVTREVLAAVDHPTRAYICVYGPTRVGESTLVRGLARMLGGAGRERMLTDPG